MRDAEFLEWLSKKDSAPCSHFNPLTETPVLFYRNYIQHNSLISILINAQQDATYSVYYISVGSSTCFGCCHPPSGPRTTVITAYGTV